MQLTKTQWYILAGIDSVAMLVALSFLIVRVKSHLNSSEVLPASGETHPLGRSSPQATRYGQTVENSETSVSPITPESNPPSFVNKTEFALKNTRSAETARTKRRIRFTYRNSHPKNVALIGDFNLWIPTNMEKGKDHTWDAILEIPPGEYTYNFIVDGRPIKDPNNRKHSEGKSLLNVTPLLKQ